MHNTTNVIFILGIFFLINNSNAQISTYPNKISFTTDLIKSAGLETWNIRYSPSGLAIGGLTIELEEDDGNSAIEFFKAYQSSNGEFTEINDGTLVVGNQDAGPVFLRDTPQEKSRMVSRFVGINTNEPYSDFSLAQFGGGLKKGFSLLDFDNGDHSWRMTSEAGDFRMYYGLAGNEEVVYSVYPEGKFEIFSATDRAIDASSESSSSAIRGAGTIGWGVYGVSDSAYGVYAQSQSGGGLYARSESSRAAIFKGGGGESSGIALEIEGAASAYGGGSDDCVIASDISQTSSDLQLVSNDAIALFLDDDNNDSNSKFEIYKGTTGLGNVTTSDRILYLEETGDLTITGDLTAQNFSNSSDVNLKENFKNIDHSDVLNKVISLPITQWNYKASSENHIGPMAQDFYKAFGLGKGETTISTVDASGVALAAIQALKKENDLLKSMIVDLYNRLDKLENE